jgi:predicted nuclease of predicted toxin-antitoxin system
LADENIPKKAIECLVRMRIDVKSVRETTPGLIDREVIKLANREDRVIITFDKDFGKLIFKEKKSIRGLILLRFNAISPEQISDRIVHIIKSEIAVNGNIIVVGEERIRVTSLL